MNCNADIYEQGRLTDVADVDDAGCALLEELHRLQLGGVELVGITHWRLHMRMQLSQKLWPSSTVSRARHHLHQAAAWAMQESIFQRHGSIAPSSPASQTWSRRTHQRSALLGLWQASRTEWPLPQPHSQALWRVHATMYPAANMRYGCRASVCSCSHGLSKTWYTVCCSVPSAMSRLPRLSLRGAVSRVCAQMQSAQRAAASTAAG